MNPDAPRPNRYFLNRTYSGGAVREISGRWTPDVPADLRFTYHVLERALAAQPASGLHFHFTKDAYALPEYGPHVVAVLLQEERCKVPVYGRHVRAVIRNLTDEPFLGWRPHRRMGKLEAVLTIEYARDRYTHAKSVRAAHDPQGMGDPVRDAAHVIRLPLGYHSQEDVPQLAMQDRTLDFFFAGQIRHAVPRNDLRYWISTSKFIAREQCWAVVQRLAADGQWRADLGNVPGTPLPQAAPVFNSYSDKMMRTRICVAPRGSVAETYRAYEGLRAGCLVVSNRFANDEYLTGAPIIQIDHWTELDGILQRYARNLDLLEQSRAASLEFWRTRIAPEVLGGVVARGLADAAGTLRSVWRDPV